MTTFRGAVELRRDRRFLLQNGIDESSGCYAAFAPDGQCLYVGRARRLLSRIMQHFVNQRDGKGVAWRVGGQVEWYCTKPAAPAGSGVKIWKSEEIEDLENRLIRNLKPVGNLVGARCLEWGCHVLIERSSGNVSFGTIRGETKDKKFWRVSLQGKLNWQQQPFPKDRCHIFFDPEPQTYDILFQRESMERWERQLVEHQKKHMESEPGKRQPD